MDSLPEVLLREIQSCLSNDDYHYLMNASKRLFGDVKRKTIYFALNQKSSVQYLQDKEFQDQILSKVENGWNQISVQCDNTLTSKLIPANLPIHKLHGTFTFLPIELWNNYQSTRLTYQSKDLKDDFPILTKVKDLSFIFNAYSETDVKDVTAFSHLEKLKISWWDKSDIKPLQSIPDLTIVSCNNVTDFSMLNQQNSLRIWNCFRLTDVSSFRSIRQLDLLNCDNFTDVRPLHGIYDLRLEGCSGITDISGLGGHYRLTLIDLDSHLIGYESLLHIPHIYLKNCSISNVSVLCYAKSVILFSCKWVFDISSLKNIKKLDIVSYNKLIGLENLRQIPNLSLKITGNIIDETLLSTFHNHQLRLFTNKLNINNLSYFSTNIKHLTIGNNLLITQFINEGKASFLQYLTSLTLESLPELKTLKNMEDIPTIRLMNCDDLIDLQGLGRNRCVEIIHCLSLEDVSSLATVPIVTIKDCRKIKDYDCLKNISRLKVIPCRNINIFSVWGEVY